MPRERPPEEELRRFYLVEKVSVQRMARHYKVANSTVTRWLTSIGVPLRTPKEAAAVAVRPDKKLPPLDRELLKRMYVRQDRSASSVANALGVGLGRVIDSLRYHGIELEQRTSKTFLPPDLVKTMYVTRRMTVVSIAAYFGVHHRRVSALLDELKVDRRKSDVNRPRRAVERFEEVIVAETFTGKPVIRLVAWLECGHKSPVRRKSLPPDPSTAIFPCKVCAQKEITHE
jgi:hypothetical protein